MSSETAMNTDLYAYGDEFQRSLLNPDLVSLLGLAKSAATEDEQVAAWLTVVAWGKCLVSGTAVSALPQASILYEAASRELSLVVQDTCQAAEHLEEAFDKQQDDLEFENICHNILAAARDVWTAYTALTHALEQCYEQNNATNIETLINLLDSASGQLDKLDETLKAQADLLSTLAETSLLENWRAELIEPYASTVPWWLEEDAFQSVIQASEKLALATMPDEQQWKQLRQQRASHVSEIVPSQTTSHEWFADVAPVYLAADSAQKMHSLEYRDWRSNDGRITATLVVDRTSATPVRINFTQDNHPAVQLAGQLAEVAGVASTINDQGNADFEKQRLIDAKQHGKKLELIVSGETWQPFCERQH